MGSDSDLPGDGGVREVLEGYGLAYDIRVLSAHRTPEQAYALRTPGRRRGFQLVIGGAGGSAHLAGVVAAHTPLPVIGVPLAGSPLSASTRCCRPCRCHPGFRSRPSAWADGRRQRRSSRGHAARDVRCAAAWAARQTTPGYGPGRSREVQGSAQEAPRTSEVVRLRPGSEPDAPVQRVDDVRTFRKRAMAGSERHSVCVDDPGSSSSSTWRPGRSTSPGSTTSARRPPS